MADELKDQRIPIMMSPSEVKAIDDWMFANRIKSRAEAIRRLCQLGLVLDDNGPLVFKSFYKSAKNFKDFVEPINLEKLQTSSAEDKLKAANELLENFYSFMMNIDNPIDNLRRSVLMYGAEKIDIEIILKSDRQKIYSLFQEMRDGTFFKKDIDNIKSEGIDSKI